MGDDAPRDHVSATYGATRGLSEVTGYALILSYPLVVLHMEPRKRETPVISVGSEGAEHAEHRMLEWTGRHWYCVKGAPATESPQSS